MARDTKPIVRLDASMHKLDIQVGRVVAVDLETQTRKPTYKMTFDFGIFGQRVSYGRFTQHPEAEVKGRLILGVLNF